MYQSVGTQFLPYIATALDLPLFTGTIKGKAVDRGAEYGSRLKGGEGSGREGDEAEDLTALLQRVMVTSLSLDLTTPTNGADRSSRSISTFVRRYLVYLPTPTY
jgi:diphthamide synthase (EF-2-diphthine--ammonia ligase)